jgi:formamidopyrimidine-DNA glycosylase
MPELPEVETVRKTLTRWSKDKIIKDVIIHYKNVLENIDFEDFKRAIINQRINDVSRYGKYLFFILDKYALISHLRMEGKYFYLESLDDEDEYIRKHKIITFVLDGGYLIYHDVRKFGKMKLVNKETYMSDESIAKLGKEPFDISPIELYNRLHNLNKSIKQCLLDQTIMAGLGNIYVDEVLFDAKIFPTRNSKKITKKECQIIIDSSIKILNRAIELKGSTIATYHFNNNETGNFQNEHKVYGKKGCNCLRCQGKIEKMVVAGRGTYYCRNCQK